MKRTLLPFLIGLLVLLGIFILNGNVETTLAESGDIPATPVIEPIREIADEISDAVSSRINAERERVLAYMVHESKIDHIRLSTDQKYATAWIQLIDRDSQKPIQTEPGLAIISFSGEDMNVLLPSDDAWVESLLALPEEVLPTDEKDHWIELYETRTVAADLGTFTGYKLPWAEGVSLYLTRSITHYYPPNPEGSMHYAFDFAAPWIDGKSPMFEIYASRSGVVAYIKNDQENGSEDPPGNYIVLEDATTTPTTYQLYLHLAKDSIPPALRTIGANVVQGQYLGLADDTGYSTGNHLHFHVHTNDFYWGNSVDITFDDVDINGGRPRMEWEAKEYPEFGSQWQYKDKFISGNTIAGQLFGDFNKPINYYQNYNQNIHIEGLVDDPEHDLAEAYIIANYEGDWHPISPVFTTSSFSFDWNICSAEIPVPEGILSIAFSIFDKNGIQTYGYPGLQHIINHYGCPPQPAPPPCIPGPGDVAIFSEADYTGECSIINSPNSLNISELSDFSGNQISSLLISDGTILSLFSDLDQSGRGESFFGNDANLRDNLLGNSSIYSLDIISGERPATPESLSPQAGAIFSDKESITLSWTDRGGAADYRVRLINPDDSISYYPLVPENHFRLPLLPPGTYTWGVRAFNDIDRSLLFSTPSTFSVETSTTPISVTVPYTTSFESGDIGEWIGSGLWNHQALTETTKTGASSWWYGDPVSWSYETSDPENQGSLTSPEITIPVTTTIYSLDFWYWNETEVNNNWDNRWVQLSIDGGPFEDFYKLENDPQQMWLQASLPLPSLSASEEHTVQVRFHFAPLDSLENQYLGWLIDDFSILPYEAEACSDSNEPNNTTGNAVPITLNSQISADICGSGDIDLYSFNASVGDRIFINLDASIIDSPLDTKLVLLDTDGLSPLAENDDEIPGVLTDSVLGYEIRRNGKYYIRVQAWDHPTGSGPYRIIFGNDSIPPALGALYPVESSFIPPVPLEILVSTEDGKSGVDFVRMFSLSTNLDSSTWDLICEDHNPNDGWGCLFDATDYISHDVVQIYIESHDKADNWSSIILSNLIVDANAPNTYPQSLTAITYSNAVHLEWSGFDNLSGIQNFDIRMKKGTNSWQTIASDLSYKTKEFWHVVDPGWDYKFVIRGVDNVGNIEVYADAGQTETFIPSKELLCIHLDLWDSNDFTNDNSIETASILEINGPQQTHNFCNPERADRYLDVDWFSFTSEANVPFDLMAIPQTEFAKIDLDLYDADGVHLASYGSADWGNMIEIHFESPVSDTYHVRIKHENSWVIGTQTSYQVTLTTLKILYLNFIYH